MQRLVITALSSVVCLMGISACANPSEDGGTKPTGSADLVASVTKDDAVAAKLPQTIKQKGGFTASINPDVAPIKFIDTDGQIAGLNPDLLRAAAKVLGTEVKFQEGTFDAMVPGLESKRYDVIASVADFVERQKKIDFIDYLQTGTAILAAKDFQQDEISPAELCGLNVGHARGTSQQGYLEAAAKKCLAAGKPKLVTSAYQDGGVGILSVKSGQADAFWGDSPSMIFNVKKNPDLYKIVYSERRSVYGIGIHKDDSEFRDALRAALLKLVENGVYAALLE